MNENVFGLLDFHFRNRRLFLSLLILIGPDADALTLREDGLLDALLDFELDSKTLRDAFGQSTAETEGDTFG